MDRQVPGAIDECEAVLTVDLADGCAGRECLEMAWRLHQQLSSGYRRNASALSLNVEFDAYKDTHRTARKRAKRAEKRGYWFSEIDRLAFEQDVFAINTSKAERQGRPMSAGYLERPVFSANPMVCPRHHVYTYGVLLDATLVAYLWLYRSGELAMISSILGHAEHLDSEVMYLLVVRAIERQIPLGGTMFYNLHSSGTDGLRFFKERIGFQATDIGWVL